MTKSLLSILFAICISGCAAQLGGLQLAVGDAHVSKTDEARTTDGGQLSIPFAGIIKDLIDTASKLIPGSGNTNVTVTVPEADIEVDE